LLSAARMNTLASAFVDGRLTQDEFHTHAGRALASRTHGELAAINVSIPSRREAPLVRTVRTDLDRIDKKSLAWGIFMILMPAALGTAFVTHFVGFLVLFVAAFIGVTVAAQPDS